MSVLFNPATPVISTNHFDVSMYFTRVPNLKATANKHLFTDSILWPLGLRAYENSARFEVLDINNLLVVTFPNVDNLSMVVDILNIYRYALTGEFDLLSVYRKLQDYHISNNPFIGLRSDIIHEPLYINFPCETKHEIDLEGFSRIISNASKDSYGTNVLNRYGVSIKINTANFRNFDILVRNDHSNAFLSSYLLYRLLSHGIEDYRSAIISIVRDYATEFFGDAVSPGIPPVEGPPDIGGDDFSYLTINDKQFIQEIIALNNNNFDQSFFNVTVGELMPKFGLMRLHTDGLAYRATTYSLSTGDVIGISLAEVPLGRKGIFLVFGKLKYDGWNWTPSLPLYLSHTGDMTQVVPTSDVPFVIKRVGEALERTLIFFNPSMPAVYVNPINP